MRNPNGMMPPWFMMPMGFQQPTQQSAPDIVCPARVEKAMQFLESLIVKEIPRVAVGEHSIERLDPVKLTTEEESTKATALSLLSKYFMGQLQHDKWEELRASVISKQIEMHGTRGTVIRCFLCGTEPRPACPLCEGAGGLFVQKVPMEGSEVRVEPESQPSSTD